MAIAVSLLVLAPIDRAGVDIGHHSTLVRRQLKVS
jgi:hypothetical protein